MTVKQKQRLKSENAAFRAFRVARKKAGAWPELKEVARELKVSIQLTQRLLNGLVERGKLEKVGRYRGYREARRKAA